MNRQLALGAVIMVNLFGFLGCGKKEEPYNTADVYEGLRNQVLTLDPASVGIKQDEERPSVWGVLMETGYPEAVVTLVALGDGTVSLYFSNGGGIIGVGEHEHPRMVSKRLIELSHSFVDKLAPTESYPLPQNGETRFYFLTFNGVLTLVEKEEILGNGNHELSPLFYKCHELIAAIRMTQEASEGK